MKKLFKVLSIVILVSFLYAPISIVSSIVNGVAEAATPVSDGTGWNETLPFYWVQSVNPEVARQLKRGNENFVVTACHPLLSELAFAQGRRVYVADVCRGVQFHVLSVTDDGRWTRGFVEGNGGKIYFFPTNYLTPFIYELPRGFGPKDCSGLPAGDRKSVV